MSAMKKMPKKYIQDASKVPVLSHFPEDCGGTEDLVTGNSQEDEAPEGVGEAFLGQKQSVIAVKRK